ncbi:YceI family protein [Piscinibacterium candidicorallinum]|uniref:YceI family protein n=1 Tax=Piscinibacterium candidicorallinum TaxID=1793872 RepID=A0ABV7GWL7_9BURK
MRSSKAVSTQGTRAQTLGALLLCAASMGGAAAQTERPNPPAAPVTQPASPPTAQPGGAPAPSATNGQSNGQSNGTAATPSSADSARFSAAALGARSLQLSGIERFGVEPVFSFVTWEVRHFATSTTRGRFQIKGGRIVLDKTGKQADVAVDLDIASVSTGVPEFDDSLRGPRFFDTAQFPDARFEGRTLRFEGDRLVEVVGEMTLRGQTHPLTLRTSGIRCYVHPLRGGEYCGGDFEGTISRGRYGMNFGWPFVGDNVRLLIQIEGQRQAQ